MKLFLFKKESFVKLFLVFDKMKNNPGELMGSCCKRGAWSMPTRRYHNLEHLTDCLRELEGSEAPRHVSDLVELALWYHDVIYEPRGRNLEDHSIQRLAEDNVLLEIPSDCVAKAAECIRATDHQTISRPADAAAELTSDIDLSILGQDVLRFMEYEYAVEEEHPRVGRTAFICARGHFLAPSIFRTARFRAHLESKARANITALLSSPRYRAHRWFGGLYRLLR
jgi:predicted metal-dependent HD superfamily phosphohydrolase